MDVLLVSGLGPRALNDDYFTSTMLHASKGTQNAHEFLRGTELDGFSLSLLGFRQQGIDHSLLRARSSKIPHLTTFALTEILERSGHRVDHHDTSQIWTGQRSTPTPIPQGDYRAVLL